MALDTYSGRVTDFSRKPFTSSEELKLQVVPEQSGYGGLGILAKKPIPVTVAPNGSFSFQLETTDSVRPRGAAMYHIQAKWLHETGWTDWVTFRATAGGGNIKDIVNLPAPPGSIAYGYGPPPPDFRGGFYLDISGTKPVLWVPEGSAL